MYPTPNTSFHPQSTGRGREPSLPPESPPQTQQMKSRPGKERQKLRQSCDACAAAKVRCTKDRPRCERCAESDLTCVYGPSMKHGKSSQKRKHPEPQPVTENFQPTSKPSEHDLQRSFSDLLRNIGSKPNPSLPQFRPSEDVPMTGTTLPSDPTSTASPSFDGLLWSDGIAYGDTGSTEIGIASSTGNCPDNTHLDSLDDTFSMISHSGFSHFINPEPLNTVSSPSSTSPAGPIINGQSLQPSKSLDSSGTHDCYAIANSTLAILNVLRRPPPDINGSDINSPLYFHSSGSASTHEAQSLDDVLSCTRDAMGNMRHLLKCPCASDPHMAMLNASVIMRILFWHQLAAGIRTSSSLTLPTPIEGSAFMDTFASSTGNPTSRSSRSSCFSTPTTFIAPEPVRLGYYIPDQEDQEPMQRLFLLINLKKLQQLINAFTQVAESVDAKPSHLHTTLASWLNSELGHAIKKIGNGIEAAVG